MILQSLRMALKAIGSNKMRSFLTILGIVIGVVAIIVLVAIAQGTNSSVTSSIESLGTNLLTVNIKSARSNPITMEGLDSLVENNSNTISGIAPLISQSVTAKAGTITYDEATVEGTVPGYDEIRDLPVASGRFLKQPDIDNRSYVAVIGTDVATELYGTTNCVGEEFSVEGYVFTVVGVFEEQGTSSSGSNDSRIVIPFTLAERLYQSKGINTFYVSATSADTVTAAELLLTSYLDNEFSATTDDTSDAYEIMNQTDMLDTLTETTDTLAYMLGGIAAISLLVGGIGIMNIMLVSVSERTREIGIRKAIGAARGNILMQFLIEALVVSVMGGLIGIIISFIAMQILAPILDMTLTMSPYIAILSVGFSLVIGVIFGLYPANKASKLRPIEALRYEG